MTLRRICRSSICYDSFEQKQHLSESLQLQVHWGSEQQTNSLFKWSKTVCSLNGPLFKPCLEKRTNSKKFGNQMAFGFRNLFPSNVIFVTEINKLFNSPLTTKLFIWETRLHASYFTLGETKNFCSALVTHFVVGVTYVKTKSSFT